MSCTQGTPKASEASRVTVNTNGSIVGRTDDSSMDAAAPYLVSGSMETCKMVFFVCPILVFCMHVVCMQHCACVYVCVFALFLYLCFCVYVCF